MDREHRLRPKPRDGEARSSLAARVSFQATPPMQRRGFGATWRRIRARDQTPARDDQRRADRVDDHVRFWPEADYQPLQQPKRG